MKNLKKVLALVVALTMVFTTVAFASYPDVDAAADYAGAVELLSALDILKGDDNGNFNPDNTITRAEFAAVVCRALGWETSANGAKGTTQFTDVAADHWASGYINLAAQQSIVNGKGNGIFDPEGNVTFTEAVKMLVVALGYNPMAEQKGGWPTGYLTVANSIRMTSGVASTGTDAAALRSTVAQLTANAIEIPVMDQVSYGTLTEFVPLDSANNYRTLLSSMDIHKVTGVVLNINEVDGEFDFQVTMPSDDYEFGYLYNSITDQYTVQLVNQVFNVADSNVADYIGQNVNIYVKEVRKDTDYDAIICMPSGIGDELTISVDQLTVGAFATTFAPNSDVSARPTSTLEYYESDDSIRTSKIYVANNPVVKVNGVTVNEGGNAVYSTPVITDLRDNDYLTNHTVITFTENTNDKYFDIIDITVYEYGIVSAVLPEKERVEFLDGRKILFDFEDDQQISAFYNAEGAEIAFEDIAEGDVLAITVGQVDTTVNHKLPESIANFTDKITVWNLGQSSVTGTITGWDNDDEIFYIDGEAYECITIANGWVTDDQYNTVTVPDPMGMSGAFYLDMNGKIIGFDGSKSVSGNYGFILQTIYDQASGFTNQYKVKVLTSDAGVVIYPVDTTCKIDSADYKAQPQGTELDQAAKLLTGDLAIVDKNADGNVDDNEYVVSAYDVKDSAGTVIGTVPANNASARLIKYDLNKAGEIDEINFVNAMDAAGRANVYTVSGEFKAETNKMSNRVLEESVIVFNVKDDVDDVKVADLSSLVNEGLYGGIVVDLNGDRESELFVMTTGTAPFAAESHVLVVDSKMATTYGDDAEDAVMVNYYTEGTNELLTAIFTEDAYKRYGVDYDNTAFKKGSVFVANMTEDGLVTEYAVIANINGADEYGLTGSLSTMTSTIYGSNEVSANVKGDKAEFVYGYISNIKGKTLTLGGTAPDFTDGRDFIINAKTAQYCYSKLNPTKPRIVVGDYAAKGVDVFEDTKTLADGTVVPASANFVLLKVYDDEVLDIISISVRDNTSVVPGILAQTHWIGARPGLNAAEEVEVEVKAEEIVVEEEIIFE